jgi:L-seryl-tRNA(Ser) seleniumtransferase
MSDDPRRRLPGVDRLLAHADAAPLLERYSRERVAEALRSVLGDARARLVGGGEPHGARMPDGGDPAPYLADAAARLEAAEVPSLRRVVNATGVVLHTNLGRAPLAAEARDALVSVGTGYANLELDLDAGVRGSRYVHCRDLLVELTGAEDALVVNNCAAALVLAVNTLAAGRPVVVSRGELVEIGGGFRIPEMLLRAGAGLREVGSTNRTRIADYRAALEEDDVGALLKVHRSNFRLSGFTEEATLAELVELGAEHGVPVIHDVGSGLLVDPARLGLPHEPRAAESIRAGADLAVFSGDKLLGGPQAGCAVGRGPVVERLRRNPLCRALRVDKGTLAALEATLHLSRDPDEALRRIPTLRMLATPVAALHPRALALAEAWKAQGLACRVAEDVGVVGGGTYPGVEVPSWTVRVEGEGAPALAAALRAGDPPVVGRVDEGELVLDLRTVDPDDDPVLETAMLRARERTAPEQAAP